MKKYLWGILAVVLVVGIVVGTISFERIGLNNKYDAAVSLMNVGRYSEAISEFRQLNGYKDSNEKIIACNNAILDFKYEEAQKVLDSGDLKGALAAFLAIKDHRDSSQKITQIKNQKIKKCAVGDYIWFGRYEQDNDTSNGLEDIEWQVISKKENKILVISKYILENKAYNDVYRTDEKGIIWALCPLRNWLNEDFIANAFEEKEKTMIATVKVEDGVNPEYGSNPGNSTNDKVFVLSSREADKYFSSDNSRKCKATQYVLESNDAVEEGPYASWWLRTPGSNLENVSYVNRDGKVLLKGQNAHSTYHVTIIDSDRVLDAGVRPAMWIDISKL
jgi:hypothetical protein